MSSGLALRSQIPCIISSTLYFLFDVQDEPSALSFHFETPCVPDATLPYHDSDGLLSLWNHMPQIRSPFQIHWLNYDVLS